MKKFFIIILSVVFVLSGVIALSGCNKNNAGNEEGKNPVYTITFDSKGGSEVSPITAKAGEAISAPEKPTKTDFAFSGWYESSDGGVTLSETEFAFTYMPAKDITLYAKWQDAVIGSWETYQVVMPPETEGGEETVVNVGEKFTFLGGETLSKDTYRLTVNDTDINLTLIIGSSNTATGSGTYTKADGIYAASIVISNGEASETFKTFTTYDEINDRLSCKILYYEDDERTLYYTLILTRVKG
ncbi:MAG: InlB B-repeat-containing protein [Eubacteriales bacterium]|nr:InlB B-repeat-containing protein [Christensenellaceae bacterium]MDY3242014.1 InlB B-repeat-containing protein [Eubacteriales bacterium]